MERRDAGFRKPFFPVFGNRLSERALETHQFLPINARLLCPNPFPFHSADPVNSFCSTDKNLFGVTSPECTRPAERPGIDDCHLPSSRPATRCHGRCGCPCSNNNKVKFSRHAKVLILAHYSKLLTYARLFLSQLGNERTACADHYS